MLFLNLLEHFFYLRVILYVVDGIFTLIFADSCVRKEKQTSRSLLLEIDHLNQTNSVQYNVRSWTKTVRMASKTLHLHALLYTSSK